SDVCSSDLAKIKEAELPGAAPDLRNQGLRRAQRNTQGRAETPSPRQAKHGSRELHQRSSGDCFQEGGRYVRRDDRRAEGTDSMISYIFRTSHNQAVVLNCFELLERETGIEPVTSSLGSWRSTAELLPLYFQ